jgi:hypothetical protein
MKSDIYTRLSRIARTAGVPLRSVLLSGWICLMYRYTGQNDLVVGSKVRKEGHGGARSLVAVGGESLILARSLINREMSEKLRAEAGMSCWGVYVESVVNNPLIGAGNTRFFAQLSCRDGPDERQAVGVFETTMPVRVDMGRIHTYREVWWNGIGRAGFSNS